MSGDGYQMVNKVKKVAVIAPDFLVNAFSVVICAAPDQTLLASSDDLNDLQTMLGEEKPDVLLAYLVPQSESIEGTAAYETINRAKAAWPDALLISILKNSSQLEKAKDVGADLAFVDGVNARRLQAAIDGNL